MSKRLETCLGLWCTWMPWDNSWDQIPRVIPAEAEPRDNSRDQIPRVIPAKAEPWDNSWDQIPGVIPASAQPWDTARDQISRPILAQTARDVRGVWLQWRFRSTGVAPERDRGRE